MREILKEYSRFNSYPMLYVDSKFVGGLTFMREKEKNGGLAQIIPSTEIQINF
jgi:glutaredoxin-related protein